MAFLEIAVLGRAPVKLLDFFPVLEVSIAAAPSPPCEESLERMELEVEKNKKQFSVNQIFIILYSTKLDI